MKRIIFLLCVFVCSLSCVGIGNVRTDTLRMVSYNIRNGMGMDGHLNLGRTVRAIRALRPDLVALQELDSVTIRSHGVYVLGTLADSLSLFSTYAAAISYQGGSYGIGLLSREKPLSVTRLPLPGREESRCLLLAEFTDYVVAVAHLSLTKADRLASIPILVQQAKHIGKPFFFAGDWNDTPSSVFIQQLSRSFAILTDTTHCTYPAGAPNECIDYISLYKNRRKHKVKTLNCGVTPDTITSDHRPVWVDVVLSK